MSRDQPEPSFNMNAPARKILDYVGSKSSVLIICYLANGTKRFNELKRLIGEISPDTLSLSLRKLERDGLVSRTVLPVMPPHVDYELTSLGRTLVEPVMALTAWAERHHSEVRQARQHFEVSKTSVHELTSSAPGTKGTRT